MTTAPASSSQASPTALVLRATAVHDDAMLSRVVAALGPHPVGAFSYVPQPVPQAGTASLATITVEVTGDSWQGRRVCAKLARIIGVLDVTQDAILP